MLNQERKAGTGNTGQGNQERHCNDDRCGKAGHLGGPCSLADIVTVLYFYKMRHKPAELGQERDRFLLSKGHAAIVQYAALME